MSAKRKQVFNEINITPLTDIFLVLLIIMMVVAPMLDYRGLKIDFFNSSAEPSKPDESKLIRLTINADGAFAVDGETVASDRLDAGVKQALGAHPDGIVIEVSPESYHEATTRALDAAKNAGITRIAVTEAEEASAVSAPAPSKPASKPASKHKSAK